MMDKTKGHWRANMRRVGKTIGNIMGFYVDEPTQGAPSLRILAQQQPARDIFDTPRDVPAYTVGQISLNKLAGEIHQTAVSKGWWSEERGLPEVLMLCVSELAEALEAYRDGDKPCETIFVCKVDKSDLDTWGDNGRCNEDCWGCDFAKPEGIPSELADCIIRILDYCGHASIDIETAIRRKCAYNKGREYRHGGKVC
jgi:NTP pyrophosphatase (non-canonical NTP hydrolase)